MGKSIDPQGFNIDKAVEHLSQAIQINTVSYPDYQATDLHSMKNSFIFRNRLSVGKSGMSAGNHQWLLPLLFVEKRVWPG